MPSLTHRSSFRASIAGLLIAAIFALSAPVAAASDSDREASAPSSAEASRARTVETATRSETNMPIVLSAAFDGATSIPVEPAPEPATRPRSVARLVASINEVAAPPLPLPSPSPVPAPAVSTAPMTVKEKFGSWFHSRFMSPGAYGSAVFNGMFKELQDNDDFKKDTVENYFADSMTRAARSYAFGTTASLYEKAILASLFRQDPRYHRSGKTGVGAKLIYAATRVFVTQGDRCGCDQFNASFLLGGAGAAVTANLWERRERTGPMHTLSRYYNHIAITAFFNIVKEFVGGQ